MQSDHVITLTNHVEFLITAAVLYVRVVHVLKLAETQKWRAELLESLDTAVKECCV